MGQGRGGAALRCGEDFSWCDGKPLEGLSMRVGGGSELHIERIILWVENGLWRRSRGDPCDGLTCLRNCPLGGVDIVVLGKRAPTGIVTLS